MVYSCKKEVNRARNDRDDARRDAENFERKYRDMYANYNNTNKMLNDTKNKLKDTTNLLNDTKNKLNKTLNQLTETQNTLSQSVMAYNTQTDEMNALTNRINVSEYFSVVESDNVQYNFKMLDRNLYTAIQDQNSQLATEIEKYRNEHSTDDQKVNYEQQNIYLLLNANYVLKWIYFILFFVFVYFLYYTKQYSIYFKIGLLALFTIYPFVIYAVQQKIYHFFKFLWSFVHPK